MVQSPFSVPKWIHIISPKKSMEGFIGGMMGGVWTSMAWIPWIVQWANLETSSRFESIWLSSPWWHRLTLGFVLSASAIVGDLVESSVKRQSQSKDSGSVLPGHGGILDRFDSSLLAILFYTVVVEWTSQ
jgi:phosphatidate cytidylyltransferase